MGTFYLIFDKTCKLSAAIIKIQNFELLAGTRKSSNETFIALVIKYKEYNPAILCKTLGQVVQ
jgi:hypothetical protein